ncbi:MAG: spermidine/putrescine transport system ATP-binding protein [Actinomycetota bacterium]|nr:spermidine/putrescine transport system ATP-binding protein [Actinomycetota bacterium]
MSDSEKQVEVGLYGVTKRFGATVAVDNVTIEVAPGEFFSLLGPSGCGKTTSLRMIAGFEEPEEGRVVLTGQDIVGVPPFKRNVNTVFQSYALFPHLTVADNVAFGLRRKKIPKRDIKDRVKRYLDLVQLPGYDERRPSQLSGGQQQRVALARALVNEPAVLLLDEPLGALDLKLRKQMQLELMRIQREVGVTFIYVTHDQEEALVMSDRIAVMSQGKVEQIGFPEDIYERPATRFVAGFIGTSNIVEAEVIGRVGEFLEVASAPGDRLLVPTPDGRSVSVGDKLAFTVRPEKLRVVTADDPVADQLCTVAGTVVDVVYQGVSTQLVVRTDAGITLVAFRQNSERVSDAGVPGSRARLVWNPEFNVVLDDEPALERELSA